MTCRARPTQPLYTPLADERYARGRGQATLADLAAHGQDRSTLIASWSLTFPSTTRFRRAFELSVRKFFAFAQEDDPGRHQDGFAEHHARAQSPHRQFVKVERMRLRVPGWLAVRHSARRPNGSAIRPAPWAAPHQCQVEHLMGDR